MWVLVAVVCVVFVLNRLTLARGLDGLDYSLGFGKSRVEIGEPFDVISRVENSKWLLVSYLKIEEHFPEAFEKKRCAYALSLLPFQKLVRTHRVTAHRRGLHTARASRLELGDLVGLKSDVFYRETGCQIAVLPQKRDLERTLVPYGDPHGTMSVNRWILDDPLMFMGVRAYTSSDPMRHIHWPSTARTGALMVKKFDHTQDNSTLVLLGCESHTLGEKDPGTEAVESALEYARAVVTLLEEKRTPYAFRSSAKDSAFYLNSGLGTHHLNAVLDHLARVDYRLNLFLDQMLEAVESTFTSLVIVVPCVLPRHVHEINRLYGRLPKVVLISMSEDNLSQIHPGICRLTRRDV